MKKWFSFSLQKQLFWVILCFIAIVVLIASGFVYYVIRSSNGQLQQEIAARLRMNAVLIEKELKSIDDISFQLFQSKTIQENLARIKKNEWLQNDRYVLRQIRYSLEEALSAQLLSKSYIEEIALADSYGVLYAARRTEYVPKYQVIPSRDSTLFRTPGRSVWIADAPDLLLQRQIREIEGLSLDELGLLQIRINMSRFERFLGLNTETRQIYIVDEQGRSVYGDPPPWMDEIDYSMARGELTYNHLGASYMLYYQRSNVSHLLYVDVMDITPMQRGRNILLLFSAAACLLVILLLLALSSRLTRAVTQPIYSLIDNMNCQEHIDIDQPPEAAQSQHYPPEIAMLYGDFIRMLRRVDILNKQDYENKRAMDQALFMALQAQINPHFLYNTLDTMNWIAKANKQDMLSQMMESLSDFLRYITDLSEHIVPLGKEITAMEQYLLIEKIRFDDQLSIQFFIEPALLSLNIPKMILQPLIENSIKHGLEKVARRCEIVVHGRLEANVAILSVSDNGSGMPEAVRKSILEQAPSGKRRGIGLQNINSRLKQQFGAGYGLEIQSVEGEGTSIIIRIPTNSVHRSM